MLRQRYAPVALTDRNNLFALVKFFEACMAEGVKPILGAEVWVREDRGQCRAAAVTGAEPTWLSQSVDSNLGQLYRHRSGVLEEQDVFAAKEGLIVYRWCARAFVVAAEKCRSGSSQGRALRWQAQFGDAYYLELTRCGRRGEEEALRSTLEIASACGIGVVATNDVCFAEAEDFEAHETRVCIHEGRTLNDGRRERRYSEWQYLRHHKRWQNYFKIYR
ncbi:MAG: hypothetical protein CM15mP120_22480 [Pseudomonadota bacterium]|nr:MAG: hypothetical protein CM15mP120_22480 [Pseudomonadota bacterium]